MVEVLVKLLKPPVFLQAPLIRMNIPTVGEELRRELKSNPRDIRYIIPSIEEKIESITYDGAGGIKEIDELLMKFITMVPTKLYLNYHQFVALHVVLTTELRIYPRTKEQSVTVVHPVTGALVEILPCIEGSFWSMV